MPEIWMPVHGWEGLYEASDKGNVRNVCARAGTTVGHVLKPRPTRCGYFKVLLRNRGRYAHAFVHRVVYEAFQGPIPTGFEIDHLDFDRRNNRPENLEAVTKLVNMQRAHARPRNRARGSRQGRAVFTECQVLSILQRVKSGEPQSKLALEFGVTPTAINCIVKRKTWRHVELPE